MTPRTHPRWELVICDVIGTLVLDDGLVRDSIRTALDHVLPAATISPERIQSLRGANKRELFEALAPGCGVEALSVFNERIVGHLEAGLIEPVPGSASALLEMRRARATICLTSGLNRAIVAAMVKRFGWSDSVDDILTGEDVARGRPHPDLVLSAALRARVSALRRVALCGDTDNDLWAGHNAGVGLCIGVLTGAHDCGRLSAAPHHHIVESITAVPALMTSIPPS